MEPEPTFAVGAAVAIANLQSKPDFLTSVRNESPARRDVCTPRRDDEQRPGITPCSVFLEFPALVPWISPALQLGRTNLSSLTREAFLLHARCPVRLAPDFLAAVSRAAR